MRASRTVHLLLAGALVAASCGGAFPVGPAPATPDPLAGQYIVNGGGGALDAVKALADGFQKRHPTVTWQGLIDIGSDAGVNLAISGETDLGYISRDLRDAEKGKVETVPIGASGTVIARLVRVRNGREPCTQPSVQTFCRTNNEIAAASSGSP